MFLGSQLITITVIMIATRCSLHSRWERTCYVASPASIVEYAAHLTVSAYSGTEAARAPPQVLIKLLEWVHHFCETFLCRLSVENKR